jgi:hypothetical protein
MTVNEMIDPNGNIINDKVNINDELQSIDGVSVHEMPVDDVIKKGVIEGRWVLDWAY